MPFKGQLLIYITTQIPRRAAVWLFKEGAWETGDVSYVCFSLSDSQSQPENGTCSVLPQFPADSSVTALWLLVHRGDRRAVVKSLSPEPGAHKLPSAALVLGTIPVQHACPGEAVKHDTCVGKRTERRGLSVSARQASGM